MKQKLFTILTLLLCICSGAWADATPGNADSRYLNVANYSSIDDAGFTSDVYNLYYYDSSTGFLVVNAFGAYKAVGTQKWVTDASGNTNSSTWTAPTGTVFKGSDYYFKKEGSSAKTVKEMKFGQTRKMSFRVSNCIEVTALVKSNSTSATLSLTVYPLTGEGYTTRGDAAGSDTYKGSTSNPTTLTVTGLNAGTVYEIEISDDNKNNGNLLYEIAFKTPLGAQAPVFSPTTGSSIASESNVDITSSNATKVYYKWTTSSETPADGWSYADANANGKITVAAPAYDSETPANNTRYLHAYGEKSSTAGTKSYAQYTITAPDTEAPTLSSTSPAANATDIAVSGNIVLTFNENVFCTTKATLTPEGGEAVELTPTVSGATVTYAYTELAYNKAYTFNLAANSVADGSGNKYASAINFSFTTVQETCATPTFIDLGSKAVKITCATEASTIYYKLNDGSYTEYSGTFIPEANGTVYAYATAEGCLNSAVAEKAITLPVVGNVTGNLLMTLQPDVPTTNDAGGYENNKFSKAGYDMANSATLQNTGAATRCPNMFKVNKGTITITPPSDVTIQSIKIFGVSNNTVSTASSVSAGTGTTMVSSTGVLTPRNYYVGDDQANGDPIISEVVFSKTTPTAGATFEFKVAQASGDNSQVRLYVEVYGTTSATTEAITPAKTYTTYIPTHNLDFTSTDKLTAYIATAATASTVTVTSVDKVPAGTPIIVKATETGSAINVNVAATADDVSSNKLKCGDGKTNVGGNSKYDYILSDGKFYRAEEGTIAVGKAYLHLDAAPAASRELSIVFEGETTGIANIEVDANEIFDANAPMYNLAGQRVNKSYKGVVIVNGKKMLNK